MAATAKSGRPSSIPACVVSTSLERARRAPLVPCAGTVPLTAVDGSGVEMPTAGGSTGKETAGASDGGVGPGPESAWGKGKEGSGGGGNDEVLPAGGGRFGGGKETLHRPAVRQGPDSEPHVSLAGLDLPAR